MTPAAAREFTDALGLIHQGGWRLVLHAMKEGVPQALGLTTREWVAELGGYVQLPLEERRPVSRELIEVEGLTQREAADVLGVGKGTIQRDVDPGPFGPPDDVDQDEDIDPGPFGPPDAERVTALPPDLVERVTEGMSLHEAEHVVSLRAKRIAAHRCDVERALVVLGRMAGYPLPAELIDGMTPDLVDALRRVLEVLADRRTQHG